MRYPGIIPIIPGPAGYGISAVDDTRAGYILYRCGICGRTEKQPLVSTYTVNRTCTCNFPESVTWMEPAGGWKHPYWVEYDEAWYWADRGVPTVPWMLKDL